MDLDETLIHSCHLKENPEIVLEVDGTNKENKKVLLFFIDILWDFLCFL